MVKKVFLAMVVLAAFASYAYGLETKLIEMRKDFLTESREIKKILTASKDALLVNSMCDSCIMMVSQLDAYFCMAGIFNTIKEENVTEEATAYLLKWLVDIKSTSIVNLQSLSAISYEVQPETKAHVEKLKALYEKLNKNIDSDLESIFTLNAALKNRKQ